MSFWELYHGPNAGYVLELYERYQRDPESVDVATREMFRQWTPPLDGAPLDGDRPAVVDGTALAALADKIRCAVSLADAIRDLGQLGAELDPLGTPPPGDPALELNTYGLSEGDLTQLPANIITGPLTAGSRNAPDVVQALRRVYTGSTRHEFEHLHVPDELAWLRDTAESGRV